MTRRRLNPFWIVLIPPAGLIMAGLLVSPDGCSAEGIPTRELFLGVGLFTLVTDIPLLAFLRYRQLGRLTPGEGWVDSTAEVMSVKRSRMYVGTRPVAVIDLLVHPPDGPPITIRHQQQMDEESLERLYVGSTVRTRMDPRDPERLLIV